MILFFPLIDNEFYVGTQSAQGASGIPAAA